MKPDTRRQRVDAGVALGVGVAWGLLSVVSLGNPDPFRPVTLIDYLAVVSFSVALASLGPAAWLMTRAIGPTLQLQRNAAAVTLLAASVIGALTFLEGGLGLVLAAWLFVAIGRWRGLGVVVRASSILASVGGPLAGFGNLVEDGFQLKDIGGALFAAGLGGSLVGLIGLAIAVGLAGRYALVALAAATVVGIVAASQYGGGFLVLAVWLAFAYQISGPDRPPGITPR